MDVELVEVLDVADVGGTEVGAPAETPEGSAIRKDCTAFRSAAGGRGIASPFGRKAIVMSWPSARRTPSAADAGTTVPFVAVGDGQVSTPM